MNNYTVPYLQAPDSNSILISWITNDENTPQVDYGFEKDDLSNTACGTSKTMEKDHIVHHVKLNDLLPDTRYFYRTKSGTTYSEIYSFKTQVDPSKFLQKLRFIVIGDHQRFDDAYPNLVANAVTKALEKWNGNTIEETVHFVINLGDQVHNGGELSHYAIHHFYKSSELSTKVPFVTVLGNHEYYGDSEAKNYFAHFDYSHLKYNNIQAAKAINGTEYYAFKIAKALFIHLNSNSNSENQTQFVSKIIHEADSDKNIEWVFASAHHPPKAEQLKKDGNDYINNEILPILQSSAKTCVYFAGHAHLYARGASRNHRIHEIINGGASWDQYWTDAPEAVTLYEDVQKTIEAHVFQLVELDFETQQLKVNTYSTGNAQLNKPLYLLDSFYKKQKENRPNTPFIKSFDDKIKLPFTFECSKYTGSEPFNSSEFQILKTVKKEEVIVLSKKRDYEKWFGSSGFPDYTPINIYESSSILELTVNDNELATGAYKIRVRYRDQNLSWSEWSETVTFTIE
ncbi:Calcineurin-like phosphoesterase [Flavobacterium succinicans]|uniref:Calcineurin-like phosphoesterase n=1 Tax=Flavobacterium succinicans TaxID=29536 RepID=A0A1I4YAE5_9FLAO|nr:fibronectin type III domain-containing protein [Flavobacterium succinicans]SFN34965.1 Calcineurin-like phosphoesterase [Flavobacterium succinicans]